MGQPLWGTAWSVLKKTKIESLYDPVILLLGTWPEKAMTQKSTRTPVFLAALFTVAKTWKQPNRSPTDEWVKKRWYRYTMEYCSAI